MSEQELRGRLERTLGRISESEWRRLKRIDLVGEYQRNVWTWEDFRDFVKRDLNQIRDFAEDFRREQAGELLPETEIAERTPEPVGVTEIPAPPLSERTAARAQALIALDNYELGPTNPDRVRSRTITSKVRPQGGFDETLPQWVIELKIEAWVPADDVRSIYQHVQRDLLAEKGCPKTQPRTYKVAQFVWEQRLRHGKRLTFPTLLERWRERYPDDEGFEDSRAFRRCFIRGAEATPPRYVHSNDYIANEARQLKRAKERWEAGEPWFGLRPS
jgi:hypothetical protein